VEHFWGIERFTLEIDGDIEVGLTLAVEISGTIQITKTVTVLPEFVYPGIPIPGTPFSLDPIISVVADLELSFLAKETITTSAKMKIPLYLYTGYIQGDFFYIPLISTPIPEVTFPTSMTSCDFSAQIILKPTLGLGILGVASFSVTPAGGVLLSVLSTLPNNHLSDYTKAKQSAKPLTVVDTSLPESQCEHCDNVPPGQYPYFQAEVGGVIKPFKLKLALFPLSDSIAFGEDDYFPWWSTCYALSSNSSLCLPYCGSTPPETGLQLPSNHGNTA